MPKQNDASTLRARGPVLDESILSQLEASVSDAGAQNLLLNCEDVREVTPRALSALLEFGARYADRGLTLIGLSRQVTLQAVQVGLAEHWIIALPRVSPNAAPATAGVRAVIYEIPESPGIGGVDVAGRALLLRQLQALRDLGIEDVVVEVAESPRSVENAGLLLRDDPLTSRVLVIPSATPLGLTEFARRAGMPDSEPFLALPSTLALHGRIDLSSRDPARLEFAAPAGIHAPAVHIDFAAAQDGPTPIPTQRAEGWGLLVRSHEEALELGCAALEGRAPGLLVHAAEVRPGVWLARGARVAPDAKLLPPVLVCAEAHVLGRAQVGPRAVIGPRSVVERDAVVIDGSLAESTILGENARVTGAHAHADGMVSFSDGARITLHDALTLTAREPAATAWRSRLFALLLLCLLAPFWLLGLALGRLSGRSSMRSLPSRRGSLHIGESGVAFVDLPPSLWDVVLGRRDLLGVGDLQALERACSENQHSLRPGAFDLSRAIAPGASTTTLIRMWRWYRANKNSALDRALWRDRGLERHPESK